MATIVLLAASPYSKVSISGQRTGADLITESVTNSHYRLPSFQAHPSMLLGISSFRPRTSQSAIA